MRDDSREKIRSSNNRKIPCILNAFPKKLISVLKKNISSNANKKSAAYIIKNDLFGLNCNEFVKRCTKNKRITADSAKITFGFSNCVTPNGKMIKGRMKRRKKTINAATNPLYDMVM